jgi:hypothetical protein
MTRMAAPRHLSCVRASAAQGLDGISLEAGGKGVSHNIA